MIRDWQSSIAHADLADWVTVAAYAVAALLCLRAGLAASLRQQGRECLFWRATALAMLCLGVNELLDLQTLLTVIGRAYARANGWYGAHRSVQYVFVILLSAAALLAGLAMMWLMRRSHAAVRLALAGLMFIGLFVLLRAASFHHLDALLGSGLARFNWGSIQEMAGIIIIAIAAALYAATPRPAQPPLAPPSPGEG